MKIKLLLLSILLLCQSNRLAAQQSLWVGETYQCYLEDYADRSLSWVNISWSVDYGLYANYSGNYVTTVSFTEYQSGTYNVKVSWTETDMSDWQAPFYHRSHTWSFTCRDNPLVSSQQSSVSLSVGNTKQLECGFTYNNSYTQGITYYSNNTSVATVSSSGLVTAKAAGTAKITAQSASSSNKVSWTITVGQSDKKVTSISLNKTSASLSLTAPDNTVQLTATVYPSDATDKSVSWSSSNTSVATVSSSGLVTAKGEGNATITCKANDGSGVSATCDITVTSSTAIEINATNFPDEAFRNWLLSQYYGMDGMLTETEISGVTYIDVSGNSNSPGTITSLKGIEFFTALTSLSCYYNQLTALDVSKNTALTYLSCYYNQLTALDVSKNTALTYLNCNYNQLTALDVSKNTALETLHCSSNQLASLDVTNNVSLKDFRCQINKLTSIDVSKNIMLELFCCNVNKITSLDVSNNTALSWLWVNRNGIRGTAMDQLISSLPNNSSEKQFEFHVFSATHDDEGNVCTTTQVAAAKAKGWTPLYHDGSDWIEYEGSDETAIEGITADVIDGNTPIYNLRGQRLSQPQKGINIIGGKKVVVK